MKYDLSTIMALFERKYNDAYVYFESEYGERGYDTPESGILLADWNHVPKFVQSWLERNGYALEWSDEWIRSDIGKIYKTSPSHNGWKPSYVITKDGSVIGKDEIEPNTMALNDYIEHLTNNPKACDCFDIDWTLHGYTKCNREEYQTGFHQGMNDNQSEVFEKIKKEYPSCDFIFTLDEASQFYSEWSIWRG